MNGPQCPAANTPQGLSGPAQDAQEQPDQGEDQEEDRSAQERAVEAIVEGSPPLSAAQRARLAILLES